MALTAFNLLAAIKTVEFVDGGAVDNLAVQVQLHCDRMGQTLARWLAVAPTGSGFYAQYIQVTADETS
ncbi:hypothetical protein IQ254_21870 [Nodosilinea sp. LEGE 07088]|uniref:hypothetical protein n=1 Tax=Nodosilinea sp. LEGE 07088 TaxID=2777968 RepID=UPI0018813A3B|nr:hypothetical protein [Nodosilinea sp. LEGE 07088]MBE9139810.1 hypothetical protein [Nodosilinea sp. LEGE 07088]